jgi:hypothetical protein
MADSRDREEELFPASFRSFIIEGTVVFGDKDQLMDQRIQGDRADEGKGLAEEADLSAAAFNFKAESLQASDYPLDERQGTLTFPPR